MNLEELIVMVGEQLLLVEVFISNNRKIQQHLLHLQLLLKVVKEESAVARTRTKEQQQQQIAAAKANGVSFLQLEPADRAKMVEASEKVYDKWGPKIGQEYLDKVRKSLQ